MPAPILLDLSHTAHSTARTGIQRVARSLWRDLGTSSVPITYDPHGGSWRGLADWELANLSSDVPAKKRKAHWPLGIRLAGKLRRAIGRGPAQPAALAPFASSGVLLPEIFSPDIYRALPTLFAQIKGPRAALFPDAVALKYPELTPPKTVARFPAYLRELLVFDGIAAISEDSRATLVDYWRWLGVENPPPVVAIPLGIDLPTAVPKSSPAASTRPIVLSVGTLEGRKNHVALLQACEQLWAAGSQFELHLVGIAHPQTGRPALDLLAKLQSAGRPIRYAGPVSESGLEEAYAACAFTIYPSLIEGFGLPVLESLARGKPCISSGRGALGEVTRPGGCVWLDEVDPVSLATAIDFVLSSPAQLVRLTAEARARKLKTWPDYAAEVATWFATLRRRS